MKKLILILNITVGILAAGCQKDNDEVIVEPIACNTIVEKMTLDGQYYFRYDKFYDKVTLIEYNENEIGQKYCR